MKNRKTKSVMKSRHFKAVTSSFVLFNHIFHPPALSTGIFKYILQKNDTKLSNPTSCSWEAIASSNSRLATKYNYDNQWFSAGDKCRNRQKYMWYSQYCWREGKSQPQQGLILENHLTHRRWGQTPAPLLERLVHNMYGTIEKWATVQKWYNYCADFQLR